MYGWGAASAASVVSRTNYYYAHTHDMLHQLHYLLAVVKDTKVNQVELITELVLLERCQKDEESSLKRQADRLAPGMQVKVSAWSPFQN
jgi:hypothetical protein